MSAPGWYPNPDGTGTQRYFDGTNWGPTAPVATPSPPPPKKKSSAGRIVVVIVGIVLLLALMGQCGKDDDNRTSSSSSSTSTTANTFSATSSVPVSVAPPTPDTPKFTPSQQNAIAKAQDYLDYTAFSREGLIKQLAFEDFSDADATFAVENIEANGGVDWNEQAVKKAKDYLDYTSFSLDGLIDQLEAEGFTPSEAQYGAQQAYGEG